MPLIMSVKLPYLLLLFARETGLFIFSPLFTRKGVILPLRIALTFIFTLILLPHLLQSQAILTELPFPWFLVVKEVVVGYLLGTLFAFIVEAAVLAGRWFATTTGFSATELLDPLQSNQQPLFVTFFVLSLVAILFALDIHHLFAYFLLDSFSLIPINQSYPPSALFSLSQSAGIIFSQGFTYLLLPLLFLLALICFFLLLSKIFPELPIFWIGLSIQLFFGFISLAILMLFIVPLIQKAFTEILQLSFSL